MFFVVLLVKSIGKFEFEGVEIGNGFIYFSLLL